MKFRFSGATAALFLLGFTGAAHAQNTELYRLHDALHLSSEQENAWRAYTAAIAQNPGAESRHRAAAQMMATLPTPRRIDLIDAEMREDMATMHRQGEAVKAFYAALTPDQQRTFDHETASQGEGPGDEDQGGGQNRLHQPADSSLPPPRRPY
jgi:hypothetical protein